MRNSVLIAFSLIASAPAASCAVTAASLDDELKKANTESKSAADEGLALTRKLIAAGNSSWLGFITAAEMKSITRGQPIDQFSVRSTVIQRLGAFTSSFELLDGPDSVIYPVLVGSQVRTSILVDKINGRWRVAAIGGSQSIRLLASAREQQSSKLQVATESFFAVRVRDVDLLVLGHRVDDQWVLTPLEDVPGLKLRKGESIPARAAFDAISGFLLRSR